VFGEAFFLDPTKRAVRLREQGPVPRHSRLCCRGSVANVSYCTISERAGGAYEVGSGGRGGVKFSIRSCECARGRVQGYAGRGGGGTADPPVRRSAPHLDLWIVEKGVGGWGWGDRDAPAWCSCVYMIFRVARGWVGELRGGAVRDSSSQAAPRRSRVCMGLGRGLLPESWCRRG
jgi:hypothetical protein